MYQTTRRFDTILENVTADPAVRRPDLDQAITGHARAAYLLSHFDNVVEGSMAGHPEHPWPPSPRS